MATTILPRATSITIDGPVIAFAIALSLVTGVLCGLWPVLRINATTMGRDVREGDLRSGSQASSRRVGNGLVVVEIALAFSLLVGAGLLVKNLLGLEAQDMGFTTDRLVAFDLSPTGARYSDGDRVTQFYADLLPKLQSMPTVTAAGLTSHLPMYQFGWNGEVSLEGGNPWKPNEAPLVEDRWIGGDYFKTMGIPIVKGRAFDDRDRKGSTVVTIISQARRGHVLARAESDRPAAVEGRAGQSEVRSDRRRARRDELRAHARSRRSRCTCRSRRSHSAR